VEQWLLQRIGVRNGSKVVLGAEFLRIHRGTIVRLDRIRRLHRESDGGGAIVLEDGVRLRVARGRWETLRVALAMEQGWRYLSFVAPLLESIPNDGRYSFGVGEGGIDYLSIGPQHIDVGRKFQLERWQAVTAKNCPSGNSWYRCGLA
jgi:hypothetical protein